MRARSRVVLIAAVLLMLMAVDASAGGPGSFSAGLWRRSGWAAWIAATIVLLGAALLDARRRRNGR